jgi:hypothetical protein
MKYLIGIPYVNRPDLLKLAVNSIQLFWPHAIIVDNSDNMDLRTNNDWPRDILIYEPSVPLTFSQSMNLLQRLALEQECDVVMFMHNDAEAHTGTPEGLLSLLESLLQNSAHKWGAVFTNYDTLAAFNMEAVRDVGRWDIILPQYFADNDYYRRIRLKGYEIVCTDLAVTHHNNASSTIKSDPAKLYMNGITFPLYKRYYARKWGGEPGNEIYTTPFNL